MDDDNRLPTRRAARLIVVSPERRVLLMRYRAETAGDPKVTGVGAFWVTPGGGLEDGESAADGASRELREETGIVRSVTELGEVVAEREAALWIGGVKTRCFESFFVVKARSERLDRKGWTDSERGDITDVCWFDADALRTAGEWDDELGPRGAGWYFASCAEGNVPSGVTRLDPLER
ncbi:MAG: NUDIX hydrolase [Phycisphaerales bacterium]